MNIIFILTKKMMKLFVVFYQKQILFLEFGNMGRNESSCKKIEENNWIRKILQEASLKNFKTKFKNVSKT